MLQLRAADPDEDEDHQPRSQRRFRAPARDPAGVGLQEGLGQADAAQSDDGLPAQGLIFGRLWLDQDCCHRLSRASARGRQFAFGPSAARSPLSALRRSRLPPRPQGVAPVRSVVAGASYNDPLRLAVRKRPFPHRASTNRTLRNLATTNLLWNGARFSCIYYFDIFLLKQFIRRKNFHGPLRHAYFWCCNRGFECAGGSSHRSPAEILG